MTTIPDISTPLPWQGEVWAQLVQRLSAGALPHALLLSGVEYCGKTRLAMALARFLLCQKPVNGHNCGSCHACELSKSGSHGDFQWLGPEGSSRVIKVDQVRQLVEFVTKTANLGVRKVAVLSPAEALHRSSANALLKSLEEPSPDTHIILVCNRTHGLPATIRSRCQPIKLVMPTPEQSLLWLDQLTGARNDSEAVLGLADAQVLLAAELYQKAEIDHAQDLRRALDNLGEGGSTVADIAALMADEPIEQILVQLNRYLCRRVRTMDTITLESRVGRGLFGLLEEVVRTQRTVASGANPNRQLLLDALGARFEMVLV